MSRFLTTEYRRPRYTSSWHRTHIFFNGVLRLHGYSPLYSKIRLGSEYEMDFVCFDTGSYGPEWRLIEIEGPNKRLFTKSDDPSPHLSHPTQQVSDSTPCI